MPGLPIAPRPPEDIDPGRALNYRRRMSAYRSLLFVPGSRHDRFGKAVAAGADAVIIDLEDAVLPAEKDKARAETLAWVGNWRARHLGIRINSPRTAPHARRIA